MWKLFLDDERMPAQKDAAQVIIERSYDSAVKRMQSMGCPGFISFDHDLGEEKTGYDVAKYLIEQDLNSNFSFIPTNFCFYVHSANCVGAQNIRQLLTRYLDYRKSNNTSTTSAGPAI